MKSVLISIQPKWCELIASGKKTVEVRKTKPKLETPFKVYIYETQGRTETPFVDEEGHEIFKGRGQVIGEFVCNRIDYIGWASNPTKLDWKNAYNEHSCLTNNQLYDYTNGDCFYEWQISDLKIYDKPRELGEFAKSAKTAYDNEGYLLCDGCEFANWNIERVCTIDFCPERMIARPPQSWCYVEELI